MSTPLVTHPIDTELLDRYLARLTTPEESEHVQRWMASHPDHTLVVEALQRLPLEVNGGELTTDTEAWLARIDIRSRSPETGVAHRNVSVKGIGVLGRHPLRRHLWSTSAAFVLGILVAVFSWTASTHHVGHRGASSSLTYTTGNGERATIMLPDGGTVMLNVASRLEVPVDYFAGNHTVRLAGEGVFTVQHHAGTPLTVLAGPAAVRVLGTSFLVRKYATDSAATVVVRDGKVAIRSVVLTAAQQVAVSHTGLSRIRFADSTQFNFTRGILTLDDVLFPEAIMELDRWYDADIRLGDPRLATLRMTVEVGSGSLAELSDNLEHTYKVRVVRNGRVLTLYPGQ